MEYAYHRDIFSYIDVLNCTVHMMRYLVVKPSHNLSNTDDKKYESVVIQI